MCELFAMSSRLTTRLTFSWQEFAQHGTVDAQNPDGWGVAFYEGMDARILREPSPSATSACAELLSQWAPPSAAVIAHVRHASLGEKCLANTQPFTRELGGTTHVFAHNGILDDVEHAVPLAPGGFRPVGDTDSEHAFCVLLERLRPLWIDSREPPPLARRQAIVAAFAKDIAPLGAANFLYSDGDVIFVHAHKRYNPATKDRRPPGLYLLVRSCEVDASRVAAGIQIADGDPEQRIVLVATVPLSHEPWQPLGEGELVVLKDGDVVA